MNRFFEMELCGQDKIEATTKLALQTELYEIADALDKLRTNGEPVPFACVLQDSCKQK